MNVEWSSWPECRRAAHCPLGDRATCGKKTRPASEWAAGDEENSRNDDGYALKSNAAAVTGSGHGVEGVLFRV